MIYRTICISTCIHGVFYNNIIYYANLCTASILTKKNPKSNTFQPHVSCSEISHKAAYTINKEVFLAQRTNSWGGTSSRHNSQSTLAHLLLLSSWSKGDPQSTAESARIQYLLPWPNQKRYRDTGSSNFQTSYFSIHSSPTGYQKAVCWWQPWLLLSSTIAVWGHNRNSFYIKYWMKQKEIPPHTHTKKNKS